MRASELKEKLAHKMLDTGMGSRPVVFLTETGETYDINDVVFDTENNVFILNGTETDL